MKDDLESNIKEVMGLNLVNDLDHLEPNIKDLKGQPPAEAVVSEAEVSVLASSLVAHSKGSSRGGQQVASFKKRDISIEVDDANGDPARQASSNQSRSNRSRSGSGSSRGSPHSSPGSSSAGPSGPLSPLSPTKKVKIPGPSPAQVDADPLNLNKQMDPKTKKKQQKRMKKLKEKEEELEDEIEHEQKVMKRSQQHERDKTRLRRWVGCFDFANALACGVFCADFCCKVKYYHGHQFASPDLKRVFLLFLIMRPLGLVLVFAYNLCVEIRWLQEGIHTLLGEEKPPESGAQDADKKADVAAEGQAYEGGEVLDTSVEEALSTI